MTRSSRRLTGLLVVALAAAAVAWWLQGWTTRPLALRPGGQVVEIAAGEPFGRFAARLAEAGIVAQPRLLAWYARLRGETSRVQAGEYLLVPGTTPRSLLEQVVAGRVLQHSLTIVEGSTFREALAQIDANPAVRATLAGLSAEEVMARLGRPGVHPEGRIFPDTYLFPRGTTDEELLRQAMQRLDRTLAREWSSRSQGLPLATPDEALTLASLVEKETGVADERAIVAGVFVNRLRRGMRLQTDPSVIYGLGEAFDGNLRRQDLQRDTPYNTYRRAGLPPTPIALVGQAALAAAVRPAETEALYFVATGLGDGRHHFASTLSEHNRNVARFLEVTGAKRPDGQR